jgi:1-deoxy-D-xylulose-5-phosphate reductoisomerase
MKRITILGSTGSIGTSALAVVSSYPRHFKVVGLTTNSNIALLKQQIRTFNPEAVCVVDADASLRLKQTRGTKRTKIYGGTAGLSEFLDHHRADTILVAIAGSGALEPLFGALEVAPCVALANKEALVMAGELIMQKARERNATVIPVDSEQSAIWQCLAGHDVRSLKKILLTASGGPFWKLSASDLRRVSVQKALRHPRWKMGRKITVDSANLMNKGLEVLEAMHLFGVGVDKVRVIIHPEAIIHSMVEFIDGVILAQLSVTDMRVPIQYAFSYPERLPSRIAGVDFFKLGVLHFDRPDAKRFPCLGLALRAARALGTLPAVMNAANEVCVSAFLAGALAFMQIPRIIERVMDKHTNAAHPDMQTIIAADAWARQRASGLIRKHTEVGRP